MCPRELSASTSNATELVVVAGPDAASEAPDDVVFAEPRLADDIRLLTCSSVETDASAGSRHVLIGIVAPAK
jgi:hypothetical protein